MSLFNKKQKLEENGKFNAVKIKTVNYRKIVLTILWALFIAAFAWSVYKNFTVIDTHTVHETKVLEQKVTDTNGIESFLSGFVKEFYTYNTTDGTLDARKETLSNYMTDDLVKINADLITTDSEVSSNLADYKIWNIERQEDKSLYKLTYSVRQAINRVVVEMKKETVTEKVAGKTVKKEVEKPVRTEAFKSVESCYSLVLYVDDGGNMVVIQNPTVTSIPVKAKYKTPELSSDGSVDSDESKEITQFLEKFFELYPVSDETTLGYYVTNGVLPVLSKEYTFVELVQKTYKKVDGKVNAYVMVKYYDEAAGLNQISQYCLGLEKKDKWQIVSNEVG